MTDSRKFRILVILTTVVAVFILLHNILKDSIFQDIEGYVQRRVYYERVISKKGLGLHKGMYWREKE